MRFKMRPIYLLVTNVISEIFKPKPNKNTFQKLKETIKICALPSTTWNELLYGAQIMNKGKRRDYIFTKLINEIQSTYNIIQYDNHSAWIQADIQNRLKEKGKTIDFQDTQIASIAISNCMILVTRNTKYFEPIQDVSPLLIENWFE